MVMPAVLDGPAYMVGARRSAKTSTYAVIASDRGSTIDCTSGTFSVTLTAAATLGSGFHCAIYNSGSGTVTIDPATTETIRTATGTASTLALAQGQGVVLMCDGSNWDVIASEGFPPAPSATITTSTIQAATSAGLAINNSSGTLVATFGAGPGTGVTFAGALSATSLTASGLTSGRVPIVTTGGLLIDSANFTYSIASGQMLLNNASGAYSTWQHNATSVGDIGPANQITGGSTADFGIASRAGSLVLGTNSTQRIVLTTTAMTVSSTIATSTFAATTASTSTVTGALVVSGGVGIAGKLFAGAGSHTATGSDTAVTATSAAGQNSGLFTDATNTTLTIGHASGQLRLSTGSTSQAMVFRLGTTEYGRFTATTGNFSLASTDVASLATSGGITVAKQVRFAQIAGTTVDGDTWHDSTQKALQTYVNGIEQTLSGCIFTQTASATIANTVTETSLFGTGVGTRTLPANFLLAGKTVKLVLTGTFADTGTPTVRLRLKYGSTTIIDSGAITLSAIAGTEEWRAECEITCRTAGASGTIAGDIWFLYDTAAGSGAVSSFNIAPTTATVDTTAAGAIDLTWQWGAADPANTVTSIVSSVEVIN